MPLTAEERAAAKLGDPSIMSCDGESLYWGLGDRR